MKLNVLVLSFLALVSAHSSIAQTTMEDAIVDEAASQQVVQSVDDDDDEGDDQFAQYGTLAAEVAQNAASGAIFSTCTLNPFAFCSGPKPSKKFKFLRACWNAICP